MSHPIIAIDAMGGDYAPLSVLDGLCLLSTRRDDVRFLLFGQPEKIEPMLRERPQLQPICDLVPCVDTISMEDKPAQALRRGQHTSMWRAIGAVKEKRAQAVVSAGNTGALMAISKFQLRTLAGIDRPAIAALWPNLKGQSVVLDLGANVDADARQLVDFALMGAKFAQILFHKPSPSVGVLNVGTESLKGHESVREAARILSELKDVAFSFHGFVEGSDISMGVVDVVVTDGFTGNIALKTAEGTAKMIGTFLKNALTSSLTAKVGTFLAQGALQAFKDQIDPRKVNGGVFLGLGGLVVKSHGGTDALGFSVAVEVALDLVKADLLSGITRDLNVLTFGREFSLGRE